MKVFKLAKELGVGSNEVMSAMRAIGIVPPDNHFCSISDDQVDAMRRYFVRRAFGEGVEPSSSGDQAIPSVGENAVDSKSAQSQKAEKTAPIIVRRTAGANKNSVNTRNARENISVPSSIFGKSVKERRS